MLGRLAAGAGIIAVAVFLVLRFGAARFEAGRLTAATEQLRRDVAAAGVVADARVSAERRVTAAVASWGARAAALKPIVLTSRTTVERYAETPAGRAGCLAADRVRGLDELDAALFAFTPADPGAGAGALPADADAPPARR